MRRTLRHLRSLRSLFVVALLLGGAFYLAADSTPRDADPDDLVNRVLVGTVDTAEERRELRFSGVTRAEKHARVGFTVGGRLVSRAVEVGDAVAEGEVMARVDDREIRHALAAAEGALAEVRARRRQLERDVERVGTLVEAKAATGEELEQTRAGLDGARAAEQAAEARLAEAERMLREAELDAPFAGTVTDVLLEPGEQVVPGRPVVILSGDGDLELEVEVPEAVVLRLSADREVDVHVPFLGRKVRGTIDSLGRSAVGPGRLFPVVARIPADAGLVAGATAELVLSLETDQALSVPVAAVINPGGRQPALFRVDALDEDEDGGDGRARVQRLDVEVGDLLGDLRNDRVTVRPAADGALEAGDRVVVGGQRGLLDGETVIVRDETARGEAIPHAAAQPEENEQR